MAINLTPLKKIINEVSEYKVYNANHNLTPINFQRGAVVLWVVSSQPVSTPERERTHRTGDPYVIEKLRTWNEYNIQLDILKTVDNEPYQSPLVPFEMEAYMIIDCIHCRAGDLHRDHGLGLSRIRTRLWMEKTHNKPMHRLVAEFTITARSEISFKSTSPLISCVDTNRTPIKNK